MLAPSHTVRKSSQFPKRSVPRGSRNNAVDRNPGSESDGPDVVCSYSIAQPIQISLARCRYTVKLSSPGKSHKNQHL